MFQFANALPKEVTNRSKDAFDVAFKGYVSRALEFRLPAERRRLRAFSEKDVLGAAAYPVVVRVNVFGLGQCFEGSGNHIPTPRGPSFVEIRSETLADTVFAKCWPAGLMPSALEEEAWAAGLSARLSDMMVRLERLEIRARRKRKLAFQAMSEAEIAKLTGADSNGLAAARGAIP